MLRLELEILLGETVNFPRGNQQRRTTKMTGPLETVIRNHNVWCCVCHGLLAGFKLAIGSLAEAAAYLAITAIHGLGAREDLKRPPPRQ